MKRLLFSLIMVMLLSSCGGVEVKNIESPKTSVPKDQQAAQAGSKFDEKIWAVTVKSGYEFELETYKKLGFNTVILQTPGVRKSTNPYNTDFAALKSLKDSIYKIQTTNMKFIIEVVSGPGLSDDGFNSSIYDNKAELKYFNKMLGEIIERYKGDSRFLGISINIQNPLMDEYRYYSIWSNIKTRLEEKYTGINFVLNIHPLSFNKNFEKTPDGKSKNDIVNTTLYFTQMSYPGEVSLYNKTMDINKNILLNRLKKLKGSKGRVMLTVKIPWNKDSAVFLQDIYEINRMLGFDINLCFVNGYDSYDFSKNETILNIIKRHSQ